MSWQMVERVLDHSNARLGARLVLLALAEQADEHGGGCFPSHERLARRTKLSARQVRRQLVALESSGELVRVGRRHKGVVEWRINVSASKAVTSDISDSTPDVSDNSGRTFSTGDVSEMSYKPSIEPPVEPPREPGVFSGGENKELEQLNSSETNQSNTQTANCGGGAAAGARAFEIAYPPTPHTSTPDAIEREYAKAIRGGATHDEILDSLPRYAAYIEHQRIEGFPTRQPKAPANYLRDREWNVDHAANLPMSQQERDDLETFVRSLPPDERERRRRNKEYPYDDKTLGRAA